MRVVVAPDSLKECLSATAAAAAMARGILKAAPDAQVRQIPMADGGEGTVESLVAATGGRRVQVEVTGPLGESQRVKATFGLLGDGRTAVLEMAEAAGLHLVPLSQRDPRKTTTFGVGEMMLAAVAQGARHLILGIGGSSTNDGGAGMAQALGYRLLDEAGKPLGFGGGELGKLARVEGSDLKLDLASITVDVACDVVNPLTGPEGASAIYGPQKGATPEMVAELDAHLQHFARIVTRDLPYAQNFESLAGAGAAGGLGGGLVAFAKAQLRRGVELVMEAVELARELDGADLCLSAEGALDASSRFGKTAVGVARLCREKGVPALVLAGTVRAGAELSLDEGVTAYFPLASGPGTLAEAMAAAEANLERTSEQAVRVFLAGKRS